MDMHVVMIKVLRGDRFYLYIDKGINSFVNLYKMENGKVYYRDIEMWSESSLTRDDVLAMFNGEKIGVFSFHRWEEKDGY